MNKLEARKLRTTGLNGCFAAPPNTAPRNRAEKRAQASTIRAEVKRIKRTTGARR